MRCRKLIINLTKGDTTMKPKVNLYVAWDKGIINPKISFSQTANYEGFAESIEEFIQM